MALSLRRASAGFALVLLLVGAGVGWRFFRFAPRAVVADRIYRARQPQAAHFDRLARAGFRSVVNLRGRDDEPWYREEIDACRRLGLAHDDIRIQTFDWPPQTEVRALVLRLVDGPFPMLLHCQDGMDRSGFAAGLAQLLAGQSLAVALAELTPAHGHVCRPSACHLHRFFDEYRRYLDRNQVETSAERFRSWVAERYCPPPFDAEIELTETPPARAVVGARIRLTARVVNRSDQPWPLSSRNEKGIRLGVRALGPFATLPDQPVERFRTPHAATLDLGRAGVEDGTIDAGDARFFTLEVTLPTEPGSYWMQIDMVDEGVHWFSDLGRPGVTQAIEIEKPAA